MLMPETVIYRGPSGTTIDRNALQRELDRLGWTISFDWNRGNPDAVRLREKLGFPDESSVSFGVFGPGGIGPLDTEQVQATERVEGLARLLRRVLPEPAKVIAHMSDVQAEDFIGGVTQA
jgi:hypothetical protein